MDDGEDTHSWGRGQGAGFSGIENALFFLDNTRMLYGDGQKAVAELVTAVKAAG